VADTQALQAVVLSDLEPHQVADRNPGRVALLVFPPPGIRVWEGGSETVSAGPAGAQPGTPIVMGGGLIYGPEYIGPVWIITDATNLAAGGGTVDVRIKELSCSDLDAVAQEIQGG
jgi:hypothetical protein